MKKSDFSDSLMKQVDLLKGKKELTNIFIEYYMTRLLEEEKVKKIQKEIDETLDNRDEKRFRELAEKLTKIQKEMLSFK